MHNDLQSSWFTCLHMEGGRDMTYNDKHASWFTCLHMEGGRDNNACMITVNRKHVSVSKMVHDGICNMISIGQS